MSINHAINYLPKHITCHQPTTSRQTNLINRYNNTILGIASREVTTELHRILYTAIICRDYDSALFSCYGSLYLIWQVAPVRSVTLYASASFSCLY